MYTIVITVLPELFNQLSCIPDLWSSDVIISFIIDPQQRCTIDHTEVHNDIQVNIINTVYRGKLNAMEKNIT